MTDKVTAVWTKRTESLLRKLVVAGHLKPHNIETQAVETMGQWQGSAPSNNSMQRGAYYRRRLQALANVFHYSI